MFIPRLLSGIVLLILVGIGMVFGGYILWTMCFALSLIGAFEMYRVLGTEKKICGMVGYLTVAGYYVTLLPCFGEGTGNVISLAVPVIGFLLIMTGYVFQFGKIKAEDALGAVMGTIYPGILLGFWYLTRNLPGGNLLAWLIFIASWGSDTFAYCTGMICKKLFTTHQMTPKLSPKKSVEGGIGGLFFATLLGVIYGYVFRDSIAVFSIPAYVACGLLCLLGGMISMVGDLAASAIKRDRGIKDYGHLIPGHGGVMDRFDSIIFTAPILYFLIVILQMV